MGSSRSSGTARPIPEDSAKQVYLPGMDCAITANDSDPDGDTLTWSVVTDPAHGELFMDEATGLVEYTPDPDYSTRPGSEAGGTWVSDSYVYQVSDGTETDTATHRFFIAPINDPPTFTYDLGCCGVWAWEDSGPYSQPWASNISPGPGPSETGQTVAFDVSYAVVEGPPDLFAVAPSISSDGTLTFTPGPDRSGRAAVTVVAHDDGGLENYLGVASPVANDQSEMATFSISIDAVDDAPVANNDARTVTEDQAAVALSVASNDSDAEGDPVTITSVSGATKGTATISANDVWYVPHANAYGTDTFTYTVSDGHAGIDTATVTITIAPIADSPVAADDSAFIPDGPALAIPVLVNDTDADGDTVLISAATQGTRGSVAITGGGTGLTYDPNPLASGPDTFTYTIQDGHGGTDTATVTVTVARDPIAADHHRDDRAIARADDRRHDRPGEAVVGRNGSRRRHRQLSPAGQREWRRVFHDRPGELRPRHRSIGRWPLGPRTGSASGRRTVPAT